VTTTENDYMHHGFNAADRTKELPAQGYTVRLINYYKDVSKDVLASVKKKMDYAQRTKAIEDKIKQIVVKIEKQTPGSRAEVAEMFLGKTYVLFVYTYLKDIRLVYAPPRSIGEYGGEEDNWMWPRHTGDFTFMRAYVGPDGKPAEYSEKNIPFKPKKYLHVEPQGVKAEDFVFILGYPGRTYRHRTSYFLAFEEEVRKPYVVELYSWNIKMLEDLSKRDRDVEIKLAPRLKGLWNTMKAYKGQLKAMRNLGLVARKKEEEKGMQEFIDSDAQRKEKYHTLLSEIETLHREKRDSADYDMVMSYLLRSSTMLNNAYSVYESSIERKKKDTDRESAYMDRNFERTKWRMTQGIKNYYQEADKQALANMLTRSAALAENKRITAFESLFKSSDNVETAIAQYLDQAYKTTGLNDEKYLNGLFALDTKQLEQMDDPFMKLAVQLYPQFKLQETQNKRRKGILDKLLSRLINIKKAYKGQEFIPDANSTLRLTYGRIRGYSPADAVQYTPFTSLSGVIEKHTGNEPFIATEKLVNLYQAKDFGNYTLPDSGEVPVNILYSTDTTGGNSGSPVLNAKGRLIGLNFDRVYEATINDYGWDEAYSRSIGVDIRYILWFLDKFGGARRLLEEMQIK